MTSSHHEQPVGAPAGAPADGHIDAEVIGEAADISGAANMVEEGAPLEPGDVDLVEEPAADPLAVAEAQLAERTADLQRLQAEFLNYKRRVERDRELIKENATFAALSPITEVLDSIDRARQHGELEDGLRTVAEQLEQVVARQGLVRFGEPGDAFDPALHDALSNLGEDPEVTVTTVKVIAKAGYRIGERVVRAAQVLVVEPGAPAVDQQA
ncbi:nucleotide exchange factor GrpE [Nocardioides sp. Bht2]|uniref:nucleotide exchange factor GrpE n=1 Tax=Nocardioides sp. Bht2 TaxID=3392297 RepID=UPI0039B60331